jgi:hypothetical protein
MILDTPFNVPAMLTKTAGTNFLKHQYCRHISLNVSKHTVCVSKMEKSRDTKPGKSGDVKKRVF